MKKRPYRVRRSGIHGSGVFATAPMLKGTKILEYVGEIVDAKEADRRGERSDHVYIFDLEDGTFIDGDPGSAAAHVNHSCDPNCYTEVVGKRVFIVAKRAIEPGEELTYDYRFDPDTETWLCACESPNCRGTINEKRSPRRARRR